MSVLSNKPNFTIYLRLNFVCDFQDDTSESDIKVKCGNDQQFVYPTTWPTCVDRLNCPKPFIDETVMSYDWEDSVGVTPEYSVEYTCVRGNKLLAPLADLDSGDEARIENLGWVHPKLFDCSANKKKLFLINSCS